MKHIVCQSGKWSNTYTKDGQRLVEQITSALEPIIANYYKGDYSVCEINAAIDTAVFRIEIRNRNKGVDHATKTRRNDE